MIKRFVSVFLVLCFCLPAVFGTGLFGFLDNERQIFWPTDINGEDVNVHFLWAEEAWIDTLFVEDLNVVSVNDYNVAGDVNATGSIEAGVCVISDCFSSVSDLDNWIDASGPIWFFNNFGIDVDGDISSDSDIFSGNDLSCVNDLDVGDDALIGGDLNVTGNTGLMSDVWIGGDLFVGGDSNFASLEADYFYGDGSGLTGILQNVDGGFANSVYLAAQSIDGGGA